ncbi:MAG: ion transporter [Methanothrix sp.]|jgi:voltage-gated potassium channel|nr:ion transporter [Methanothrix sp.]MBC7079081.1 ion transporter [Methanothrix sp.]NPU87237.1 ion transporter [Methanothrix sp.]
MSSEIRHRVYRLLEPGDDAGRYIDLFIICLIVLNVIAVMLETVLWISAHYASLFRAFEIFSVAVFTIEYILRVWSCTVDPRFREPIRGRLRFMVTPLAVIDLLAFLPFYLPFVLPDTRVLRVVRLFRLFRVMKLARYSESVDLFIDVLKLKKDELLLVFVSIMILLLVSSTLMYEVEHDAQPDKFSSIPAAMWWGLVTLATVGYGDMFPITPAGKLIGSMVVMLGIGLFALPAGIIASGFSEVLQRRRECREIICPHCGRPIKEEMIYR